MVITLMKMILKLLFMLHFWLGVIDLKEHKATKKMKDKELMPNA